MIGFRSIDRRIQSPEQLRSNNEKAHIPSPSIIPLSSDSVLAKTVFGSYLVVPMWNVDVVTGIVRDGVIELHTTAVARILAKPGMAVVNVGANFGYYTVYYATLVQRTGTVYSVEANIYIIPFLMRTIYWAGFPDVIRLFHAAASNIDGQSVTLSFDPQFIGGGSVADPHVGRDGAATIEECLWENTNIEADFDSNREWRKGSPHYINVPVETRTLDTICSGSPKIDIIHMDIEGFEAFALDGARETIRRSPDIALIVEFSPHYANQPKNIEITKAVMLWLFEEGFKVFRIETGIAMGPDLIPTLVPVNDIEALYRLPHGDIVICRDIQRAASPGHFVILK